MAETQNCLKKLATALGGWVLRGVAGRVGDRGVDDQHAGADLCHEDHLPASRASAADR